MKSHRIAYIVLRFSLKLTTVVQASIAIIVKGYPRLSETFIAQEIHAFEKRGLNLSIISLRLPTDTDTHSIHRDIRAPVLYLPEYLYQQPIRVLHAWWRVRKMPGYKMSRNAFLADLSKDRTSNRIRRFGQALVLSAELPERTEFLYAHFMHTPGSVARYTSLITGLPWSCSAHAKDVWTLPDWEKKQKLDECAWLISCTAANVKHLRSLAPDPDRVSLVYHGLDFDRFCEPPTPIPNKQSNPLNILSVGRAVEKKGFNDLLEALTYLPEDIGWLFVHIGGGPLISKLKQRARSLRIADKIDWRGPQSNEHVLKAYREADIFVLPSQIAADGDRDGLPNVLLEAQSQRLPCVSTDVSGIPELVENNVTGLLVKQKDPIALATALQKLLTDPDLRVRLGQAGFERVRERFSAADNVGQIIRQFPPGCVER